MEGGLPTVSARLGRNLVAAAVIATALLLVASIGAGDASAKGKKIHACVVKKGPDKGAMHFSRKGKCGKGEKKLSWNKKGKAGKQGSAGPKGETGPEGPSGVTDELLATIAAQQAAIDQLKSQVTALTSQLNALSPTVAALCSQMTAVTSQTNALGTALGGLTLNALLTGLGGALNIPALPAALAPFTCP
jgi:uncharacterized coiled-coil protein SlyX